MNVLIELNPDVEARTAEKARAQGLPVEAYFQSVINDLARTTSPDTSTLEEWDSDILSLSDGSEGLPILPQESLTREAQ